MKCIHVLTLRGKSFSTEYTSIDKNLDLQWKNIKYLHLDVENHSVQNIQYRIYINRQQFGFTVEKYKVSPS